MILRQISLFQVNRPGVLARVTEALAAHQVNLMAISVSDTVDHAVIRMVVDDPDRAVTIFNEEPGFLFTENAVLGVKVPNSPGALAGISRKLAHAQINIDYAYGSSLAGDHETLLVLRVSDLDVAQRALG